MFKGVQLYQWTGESTNRLMRGKKAEIEKIRQRQDTAEAGQSTIGNRSESVLGEFDSYMSLFSIFSSVCFL
jgi:hypothetical protein